MSKQSKSPLPLEAKSPSGKKVEGSVFDFPTAMSKIIDKKKISKKEWGNKNIYCVLANGLLIIHKDNTDFSWIISEGDLTGTDWFVV